MMEPRFSPDKKEPDQNSEEFLKSRKERHLAVAKFFRAVDVENIVEDQEKKKEFIEHLSYEDFKALLIRLNGMFRDRPINDRGLDGPTNVRILDPETHDPRYSPPLEEDKEELLNASLAALKRMGPSQDSAAMIGTAVNAIHPFRDGNGRTARFLYTIIASSKDQLDLRDVCPEEIQYLIEKYVDQKIHHLPKREKYQRLHDLKPKEQQGSGSELQLREAFANAYFFDAEIMTSALEIFCRENDTSFEEAMLNSNRQFSMHAFLKNTQPRHLEKIMGLYRTLKKEYVETIIDSFEHSEKYPLEEILPEEFANSPELSKAASGLSIKDLFYKATSARSYKTDDGFSWDTLINFYQNAK